MVIAMDMVASFRPCMSLSSSPLQLSSLPIKSSLQHVNSAFRKQSHTLQYRISLTRIRCHTAADVAENVNRAVCPPVKADVDITAFQAIDIRVGLITQAKSVIDPEVSAKRGKDTPSRTHLELRVDIGCEVRTVVSECKYVMDVEDAVGKVVLFVANIAPQEVLGIRSHGYHCNSIEMVLKFIKDLVEAMGKDIIFVIEEVSEGDDLNVVVLWHLECEGKALPFTKGCSFYRCEKQGEKMVIRFVYDFMEPPLKPGQLILNF